MRILLSRGKVTLVDAKDFAIVAKHTWSALKVRDTFYAVSEIEGAFVYMHRLLMQFPICETDHRNGDGLDNRRRNLRLATNSQNQANRGRQKNNKSGFKGVSWSAKEGKWRARIKVDYREKFLGCFIDPRAAHAAYAAAAEKYFGEFAHA